MSRSLRPWLLLAAALGACAAPGRPGLTDLSLSRAPLRAWFEAHAGQPRALLLLSPT